MSPTRSGPPFPGPANQGSGQDRLRRLRRRISWHRRWWAAGLAAAAVFTTVQTFRPAEPETVDVLVAARDLPAGRTLERSDLEHAAYPVDTVPAGALPTEQPPTGRALVAPLRAGTPLTDRSLVGRPMLRSLRPGTVAASARIADPELLRLVRVGDRVDVVAGGDGAYSRAASDQWASYGQARVVARSARVLAIPEKTAASGQLGADTSGLVLLAVAPETALELAGAGAGSALSLVLHGSPS